MNFIMLVGLPGAGKSTIAQKFTDKGYTILSPDQLRNELNIHEIDRIRDILDILYEKLEQAIQNNDNIVYDSTNLTVKRRREVLDLLPDTYNKICYIVEVPIELCKKRNSHRIGYSKVSEEEYDRMEQVYTLPTLKEGWDEIIYLEE